MSKHFLLGRLSKRASVCVEDVLKRPNSVCHKYVLSSFAKKAICNSSDCFILVWWQDLKPSFYKCPHLVPPLQLR